MDYLQKLIQSENDKGENVKLFDVPFDIKEVTDDGIIEGFGAAFGGPPDSYGDIILEGAFKETIAKGGRNGTGFPMLWQHNYNEPIGIWTELIEKSKGLKVRGEVIKEVQKGKEAHALAKKKVITGLSIGWDYLRDIDGKVAEGAVEWDDDRNIRFLKRLELWEISPVTFPANTRAQITKVKQIIDTTNITDLEKVLCDSGLSKKDAQHIISICKNSLVDSREEKQSSELNEALSILRKGNAQLYVANAICKL